MTALTVSGEIALKDFWPDGGCDGDTVKLRPPKGGKLAFGRGAGTSTKAFEGAYVKAKGEDPVRVLKRNTYINVRLQGVDTPELHYRIYGRLGGSGLTRAQYDRLKQANKTDYRQPLGETAAVALRNYLAKFAPGKTTVPAKFITANVDKPGDVVDRYGRFVGDIRAVGAPLTVNEWLLSEGMGFPAFYDSMTPPEVNKLLARWNKGRKKTGGVGVRFEKDALKTPWQAYAKPPAKYSAAKDKGKAILPKLFRRIVVHKIRLAATGGTPTPTSFDKYLKDQKVDQVLLRKDLAAWRKSKNKALLRHLSTLAPKGVLGRQPEDIVFIEDSTAVLQDANGKSITKW